MLSMWDLLMCIHRNKRLIVLVTALALVIGYWYTSVNQTYTAQVIIKYTGERAVDGLNDNGTPIDPFEISNPQVLERAMKRLSMSANSIENIRKSMKIEPIIPDREQEKDQSFVENAFKMEEEKKYNPVYYKVTLNATSEQGTSFARNVLDAVMEQYMSFYSDKYLNNASVSNISSEVTADNYDYIRLVEILGGQIDEVQEYVNSLSKDNPDFRSSSTGLTFEDINTRLAYIKDVNLSVIEGEILEKNITKNKDDTVKNYNYRSEELEIDANSSHKKALETHELMKLYAKKNDVSLWDSPTSNGDTQESQVTDVYTTGAYSREKTTYDDLVDDYVENESEYKTKLLQSKEAKAIADSFAQNQCSATEDEIKNLEGSINEVRDEIYELVNSASETVKDFNEYKSAQNISYVTGILVRENLPRMLYLIVFLVIGFGLAVVSVLGWNIYQNVRYECIRRNNSQDKDEDSKEENVKDEFENVFVSEPNLPPTKK